MVDRLQPLAATKLAIVSGAVLIAGAGLLFYGRMTKQPSYDQIPVRCADVIENSPCSPRLQLLYPPPQVSPPPQSPLWPPKSPQVGVFGGK
jgi:hypothetical protein